MWDIDPQSRSPFDKSRYRDRGAEPGSRNLTRGLDTCLTNGREEITEFPKPFLKSKNQNSISGHGTAKQSISDGLASRMSW